MNSHLKVCALLSQSCWSQNFQKRETMKKMKTQSSLSQESHKSDHIAHLSTFTFFTHPPTQHITLCEKLLKFAGFYKSSFRYHAPACQTALQLFLFFTQPFGALSLWIASSLSPSSIWSLRSLLSPGFVVSNIGQLVSLLETPLDSPISYINVP